MRMSSRWSWVAVLLGWGCSAQPAELGKATWDERTLVYLDLAWLERPEADTSREEAPPAAAPESPAPQGTTAAPDYAWSVSWSADGRTVAVVGQPWGLALVSVPGGEVRTMDGIRDASFSPRGDLIAVTTRDRDGRVLRVDDLEVVADLDGRVADDLTWSGGGGRLAARDGAVWSVASGARVASLPIDDAFRVGWAGGGRYITSWGLSARLWDVERGLELGAEFLGCGSGAVSPGGLWVANASSGHDVYVWPLGGEERGFGPVATARVSEEAGSCEHVTPEFSHDGSTLHVTGGGRYRAMDTTSWRLVGYYEGPPCMGEACSWVSAHAPDGSRVVVDWTDGKVTLWHARDLYTVATLPLPATDMPTSFSPDGRRIARAVGRRVYVLSAVTGALLTTAHIGAAAAGRE